MLGELRARYAGSAGGLLWAVLSPLALIAVYAAVFGGLFDVSAPEIPARTGGFGFFVFAGLVPWLLVSRVAGQAPAVLLGHGAVIRRFRVPPALIPTSLLLVAAVEVALATVTFGSVLVGFAFTPSPPIGALLPGGVLLLSLSLGLALGLSAANVYGRDVGHFAASVLPFWFFATPIAYPASTLPAWLHPLLEANPLTGFAGACRWALLGSPPPSTAAVVVSCVLSVAVLEAGAAFFRAVEPDLVDLL